MERSACPGRELKRAWLAATLAAAVLGCRLPNRPPEVTSEPSGPDSGRAGVEYRFWVVATDPDRNDRLAVRFAWDDGDTSAWSAYVNSHDPVEAKHIYADAGSFLVRAQAQDLARATSAWSPARAVFIMPDPVPPPPGLLQPGRSDTIDANRPSFVWHEAADAARYWLRLATDSSFSSPQVSDSTLRTARYRPWRSLPAGWYYWSVRARNASGTWGEWSAAWDFTLEPVRSPTLVRPPDSAVLARSRPLFAWHPGPRAARSWLQVSEDPGFGVPVISDSLADTTYVPITSLDRGSYFWRVRARSEAGEWSAWTGAWSFSVVDPVLDVACTTIIAPAGTVDSGKVVIPACLVHNYGNQSASYRVRMKSSTGYDEVALVSGHSPGSSRQVNFPAWTADQRGICVFSCSTGLAGDADPANDKAVGLVEVRVLNVACAKLVAPVGTVDSATRVTPACSLHNPGTRTASYVVRMRIGEEYEAVALVVDHAPGTARQASFPVWTATRVGEHPVSCSTELAGDMQPADDRRTGTITVRRTWREATPSAGWSARGGHTSVAFDNRLWVLGGRDSGYRNDVWWSADGIEWVETTGSAPWSGREHHASVAFDSRLWVLGGWDLSFKNDAWYSADGIEWTRATGSASWSGRYGHTAVVFKDRLWVLGGWDSRYRNDAWWSGDGVNWTLATSAAPWSPRSGHAAAVFDGRLWVMGGWDGGRWFNDAWYTEDGANWTLATPAAGWTARRHHTAAAFDGRLWVMGGWDGNRRNDVWHTGDGVNWELATPAAGWTARRYHAAVASPDRLWVLGGNDDNPRNDVWYYRP